MDENESTVKRNGFSAKWSGAKTIGSIVNGYYNVLPLTLTHLLVLFLLYWLFMETQLLEFRGVSALFPLVFIIAVFFVYTHLFLNYMRAFLFGPEYVGAWSIRHPDYTEEQTLAARKLYLRFTLSFLILGVPLGLANRLNTYVAEIMAAVTSSGFLFLLVYGAVSFVVWMFTLTASIILCTPYGRRAIGDVKISLSEESVMAQKCGKSLTSQPENPVWVWCAITGALIWLPEFLLMISDVNGWLDGGYESRIWSTYLLAFEFSILGVYKYLVYAGFIAFLFVRTRPDAEDEILNKTDRELAVPRREPKSSGGFIATMAADSKKDNTPSGSANNDHSR